MNLCHHQKRVMPALHTFPIQTQHRMNFSRIAAWEKGPAADCGGQVGVGQLKIEPAMKGLAGKVRFLLSFFA